MGIIIPILPDVIRRFGTDPTFVNHYYGYFVSVYALMQFLASPVLGTLSDKYGRRPILLVSLLGAGLDFLLMAWAPTLAILFLGRLISGLTGAGMTVASSYMADISDDANRSANFGMIGAAFGMGFIIGPVLGGLCASYGHSAPFIVAAALNLLNFGFGLCVLPESLPVEKRRHISWARMNPFSSLAQVLRPSPILILVVCYMLIHLAGQAHPSIWTLYTQHKFSWNNMQVSASLSFVGVVIALSQGLLTRVLIPRFGEQRSLIIGMWFYIVAFAMFAFATQGWMMYAIMVIFAVSGVCNPALQSLISKDISASEQGELQGSLISIASLMAIIGPLFYTSIFATFSDRSEHLYFPGVAYASASGICVLALVFVGLSWRKKTSKNLVEPPAAKEAS